ncbi:MAG: GNAT family N-acetyltransferase [Kiritimatiellae bacterium]|nr:GNAT family N-acetyltransferase [Kiritimatiellia bacterium]
MFDIRRVVTEQDVAEVALLAREIWSQHYLPIIGQAQVDYMLDKYQSVPAITGQMAEGYEYYLAVNQGASAGYLALVPDVAASTLMISKIYVKHGLRGQCIGRKMLALAERRCSERGLRSIWLTVNKHNRQSIQWYERNGFVNAGALVADIGGGFVMDDLKMVKEHAEA